jgi:hypothetical protein
MIDSIQQRSEEFLNKLKDMEQECYQNETKLEKTDYKEKIKDEMSELVEKLREVDIKDDELIEMNDTINKTLLETKSQMNRFEKRLLMNKIIEFEANDSKKFGRIEIRNHLDLEMPNFINILYKFIISLEFEKEVNNIFNLKNKKLFCKNIVTSIAEEKSFLIPHMDSIANERTDLNINFIYFVDGNDQDIEYSGGTSIYADNAAENVLLKPSTLKNSLLIYDNTKNFFHGFKIMKKNNYRKAVTFQFNLTDI